MKTKDIEVVEEVTRDTLELVVVEKTVGSLNTSISKLEEIVKKRLEDYTPDKYFGDADLAKKDRAELNRAKETIKRKRIEIINELMKPYADFEERCKVLEKMIDKASKALDEIVKTKEGEEKDRKREIIETLWQKQNCTVIPLEKIFNPKWLNKTFKETDIMAEMENTISRIYGDLKVLEKYSEPELLKAHYLISLDIQETFSYYDELQSKRELAEKEAKERSEREHEMRIQEQKTEVMYESCEVERKQEVDDLASLAIASANGTEVQPKQRSEYVVTVKCFDDELIRLKSAMNELGIEYSVEELSF